MAAFEFVGRRLSDIDEVKIDVWPDDFHSVGESDRVYILQHDTRKAYVFQWYVDNEKFFKDCSKQNTIILDIKLQEEYTNKLRPKLEREPGTINAMKYNLFFDIRLNGYYNAMIITSTSFQLADLVRATNFTIVDTPILRLVLTDTEERELGPLLYSQIRMYGEGLYWMSGEWTPTVDVVAMTVIQKYTGCTAKFFTGTPTSISGANTKFVQVPLT